ncbi:MAG: hypothetical protein AABW73_04570 [Nanoarchaeota archaeon]
MGNYEYFYPGTPSILESEYSTIFQGYKVPAANLGATTSINTANQLKQVGDLMKQGIRNIEVSLVHKKVFDQIPAGHMKEIANLAKLNKAEISLHAPFDDMTDPSGFSKQGGWSEENRKQVERELMYVVERGQALNTSGNMPIVFHSSAVIPGSSMVPGKDGAETEQLIVYNYVDNQLTPIKNEEKYYLSNYAKTGKGKKDDIQKELADTNSTYWDNKIKPAIFRKAEGEKILEDAQLILAGLDSEGLVANQKDPRVAAGIHKVRLANEYFREAHKSLNSTFHQAVEVAKANGNQKLQDELRNISKKFLEETKEIRGDGDGEQKKGIHPLVAANIESGALNKLMQRMEHVITNPLHPRFDKEEDSITENDIIEGPKAFVSIEEFAKKNTSETFSEVAFQSYKRFPGKAPVMAIENPPYGGALSSGKELKELIEMSRQKFAQKLFEKEGMSLDQATKIAERTIGATWDTVHIGKMVEKGFTKKDIMKETETIAPFVKHVHLNDSLGGSTDDVVPGMGDIQIKETLEAFNKANKDFGKTRKIFEGGAFVAQWQTSPQPMVLEAMGSPIYVNGTEGVPQGLNWNRAAGAANQNIYYSGMGDTLPDYNFQSFGAGFTGLPTSLGGQMGGARGSRFSGTPMA